MSRPVQDILASVGLTDHDVLDAIPDCITLHEATGRTVWCNRAAERTYGYSAEEFCRLPISALSEDSPAYSDTEALKLMRQALAHGTASFPWRARRKNGELFWGHVVLRASTIGGRSWIVAVTRDVDELHRAERALAESEERLSRVFNHTSNGLALTDFAGRILDVNQTWETLSGVAKADAVGRTAIELGIWANPADREACRRALLATGLVRDVEAAFVTTTGRRTFLISAQTFSLGPEDVILWEFRDIHDRRQLEAQLLQAQKLESVGRLAGGIAHDFNNMLSVIVGHVEALLAESPADAPGRASLTAVLHAASRSAELTRRLLAFARQQPVLPRVVHLDTVVTEALQILRRLIGEDIEVVWAPGPDPWVVRIDPSQVDQILTNLCVNARDAIQGAGRITIETAPVTVDAVHAAAAQALPGDYVRLSVSDTGAGIQPADVPKIFEPFFSTKPVGEGTGLGLSMVHGIVLQNQGFIEVTSELGQGTRFAIYIPRSQRGPVDPDPATLPPAAAGRGEHVLVVEDEPMVMRLMHTMLTAQGFVVTTAATPDEAVALAADAARRIDVVVSDIIMPGMNGRQLLVRLRELRPGLKCLLVSGYTADVLASRGDTGEQEVVLPKPFTSASLVAHIQAILR